MADINRNPENGARNPRFGGRGGRRPKGGSEFGVAEQEAPELSEKVVFINRSSKVVKGGRRFSFSALIVVGDRKGKVGVGLGKASEVAEAIRKAGEVARRQMISISLKENTIPHEIFSRFCGAKVLLRPASPGTGVIAGRTVRSVLEAVGVKDILTKSLGSSNPANVVKATLDGLKQLRLREDIFRNRGIQIKSAPQPAEGASAVLA